MTNESLDSGIPKQVEFSVLSKEVISAMDTMRTDIGHQAPVFSYNANESVVRYRNLFEYKVNPVATRQPIEHHILGTATPTDKFFVLLAHYICDWKLPEMILLYRRLTKKDRLPNDSNEFLQAVKKAEPRMLRDFDLSTQEVEMLDEHFSLTDEQKEIPPTAWLTIQLLDVCQSGLGLRNLADYIKRLKNVPNPQIPSRRGGKLYASGADMRHVLIVNEFSAAINVYVHSDTLKRLHELSEIENKIVNRESLHEVQEIIKRRTQE